VALEEVTDWPLFEAFGSNHLAGVRKNSSLKNPPRLYSESPSDRDTRTPPFLAAAQLFGRAGLEVCKNLEAFLHSLWGTHMYSARLKDDVVHAGYWAPSPLVLRCSSGGYKALERFERAGPN
jgi:hypothetical protein